MASAIVAMLNQFSYTWLAEGGEGIDIDFDEEQAIKTLADIWYHAIYWKPSPDAVEADDARPTGSTAPRSDRPPASDADERTERKPSCRAGSTSSNGEPARSATRWRSSTTVAVVSRTGRCSTGSSAAPAGGPPPE